MKRCARCHEEKPLSEFHKESKKRTRYHCYCKSCVAEWRRGRRLEHAAEAREWNRTHPEKLRERNRRQHLKHGDKIRSRKKAYRLEHPDKIRATKLRRYGVSVSDYERILERQGGGCAICGSGLRLSVDHDHSTGFVRGVLCRNCNSGIGMLQDNETILLRAAAYLSAAPKLRTA